MSEPRGPDGRTWKVRRRWLPKRPRIRKDTELDPLLALDVADGTLSGVVVGVAIGVVVALAIALVWPIFALALELSIAAVLLLGGAIGRLLFGRPWRVVADTEGPPREELAWDVRGWRVSREAVREDPAGAPRRDRSTAPGSRPDTLPASARRERATDQGGLAMSYEHVIWEQHAGVGRITLNRPQTLNAWTAELGHELKQAIEGDAADPSVRAVLITGAGRGFSSGADLRAGFDSAEDGMPDIRKELHQLYHPIIAGVRRLEKPVVAAVNGPAVGIGASLAFACDLVLAAESAYFGLAFVNIGLMPDGGSTLFVPAAVGKARAFQMALLGERVQSRRALEWGLVNFVYPDDALMDEANSLLGKLAAGPTRSYAGSKQALNRMLYPDLDGQLDLEAELQHALARTHDFQEGVLAFVEKREPAFEGS